MLELRVHGVNNTTPAALADLAPYELRQVGGDKRSSFWLVQPDTERFHGERGYVTPGIRREAYSWGGLVRDDPGSQKWFVALAFAFQVFALPFSLGNAAMWTRRLLTDAQDQRVRAGITAGLTRLFGLILTLLFVTTVVTLAVDMAALQCANSGVGVSTDAVCTGPWAGVWGWVSSVLPTEVLTADRVLAIFTIVPMVAVGLLAWFAGIARGRYDTAHIRRGSIGEAVRGRIRKSKNEGPQEATVENRAVLAQPAFWSNRVAGLLGLLHLAAAVSLTVLQVALHAAIFAGDAGYASVTFWRVLVGCSAFILLAAVSAAVVLPTQTITPPDAEGGRIEKVASRVLLASSLFIAGMLFMSLWFTEPHVASSPTGLLARDWPPLVLVAVGTIIAVSGVAWRPKGTRSHAAWGGCGPAVFMSVSLALSMLTSASVIAFGSMLAGGFDGPGLLFEGLDRDGGLSVPPIFIAVGSTLACGLVLSLVTLALFLIPRRRLEERTGSWGPEKLDDPGLLKKVNKGRRVAANAHLVEPAAAVVAFWSGAALGVGLVWTIVAETLGTSVVGYFPEVAADVLAWLIGALAGIGVALAILVVVFGVWFPKPGLVAIIWDITCFLPRTAQPFGPPCYAERAVPDVAQRLANWFEAPDWKDRRVVLAAHSMGAMVAVAALALLGASLNDPKDPELGTTSRTADDLLPRISLLTFGVQLRAFFGRFFPELVGPRMLGTLPSRAPRPWLRDPWQKDATVDERDWKPELTDGNFRHLRGKLLPEPGVRWVNLWRLTDYIGFAAAASVPHGRLKDKPWYNDVDVYASEIDYTIEPAKVVKHNDYFRVDTYETQLSKLAFPALPSESGDAAEGAEPPGRSMG